MPVFWATVVPSSSGGINLVSCDSSAIRRAAEKTLPLSAEARWHPVLLVADSINGALVLGG